MTTTLALALAEHWQSPPLMTGYLVESQIGYIHIQIQFGILVAGRPGGRPAGPHGPRGTPWGPYGAPWAHGAPWGPAGPHGAPRAPISDISDDHISGPYQGGMSHPLNLNVVLTPLWILK